MSDPKDIFKKFGKSARHVLISAQRIAQNMGSGVGSEHILLALTATAGNLGYDLLKENTINLDQVKLVLSLNNIRTNINQGLSQEAKDILIKAAQYATKLKHSVIESEHLLWAIVENSSCRAYQVIKRVGVNPEALKNQLNEIMLEMDEISSNQNIELLHFGPLGAIPFRDIPIMQGRAPYSNRQKSKTSTTPLLDQFGVDLTLQAKEGKLDPVVGRENEIGRTIQILCRRTKNNPVLVGEPGVGKTAIVEGLAQKINSGKIPAHLRDKRIINLDLSMIVAGTMYRGQFEDRLKRIITEVIQVKNIILFVDEIHMVIGAGGAEGSMDAANILKPSLAKGQIRLIGATTVDEYRKYIEKDAALERRLQVVKVKESSIDESIKILSGIKSKYEEHHKVKITDEAIKAAVVMASRYIADRYLPDKAIDLIDEAAAKKNITNRFSSYNDEKIQKLQQSLAKTIEQKEKEVQAQNYQNAANLKSQEIKTKEEISKIENTYQQKFPLAKISHADIAQIVSMWTGIPLENLIQTEKKKLLNLDKTLAKRIIGQDEPVTSVANAIKRAKSRITNPDRPIGTFIFLGPTGVGKTELAKVLAEEIFTSQDSLVKIDMSEFTEKHNVSRLVGAPPGYVGYDEAGKLTEAVRGNPYSLILFDEIEKAHPEIFNILLQILEDGYLTDAKGRRINFKNTIIIMTSNIGVGELTRQAVIGFKAESKSEKQDAVQAYEQMKQRVLNELKKEFRPELLNRIDKIIVFKPLDKKSIRQIVDLQVNELCQRIKEEKINLEVDDRVRDHIAKVGYDPKYGARPIRRKISDLIEDPLSDKILSGDFKLKDKIKVTLVKNRIVLKTSRKK